MIVFLPLVWSNSFTDLKDLTFVFLFLFLFTASGKSSLIITVFSSVGGGFVLLLITVLLVIRCRRKPLPPTIGVARATPTSKYNFLPARNKRA